MRPKDFNVEDVVTVFYQNRPQSIRKVTKVTKRFVELDDTNPQNISSRWAPDGGPYPRQPYPMSGIQHTTPEHREAIKLSNARAKVRAAVKNEELSPEVWFELREVLRRAGSKKVAEAEGG